jgi:hypothetical protein
VSEVIDLSKNRFSLIAMVCGGCALAMVIFHFWAGPFEPQKTLERTIAETAVNISNEVMRVRRGEPAVPKARNWNTDKIVQIVVAVAGVLAILTAVVGFVRREDYRQVIAGVGLGGAAVAFQFVTWLALLAAGLILLWIIIANLSSILSLGGG